jgi:uncharacterized protein
MDWRAARVDAVAHATEAHSLSAAVVPETLEALEAKMLQDADRFDAIGMLGAARCFYVAGGQERLRRFLDEFSDEI